MQFVDIFLDGTFLYYNPALPKNVLYFHTTIFLDIQLKVNVYKKYVQLVYVQFPGMGNSLKTFVIELILINNNILKVNDKCSKARCEISPSLAIKTISLA